MEIFLYLHKYQGLENKKYVIHSNKHYSKFRSFTFDKEYITVLKKEAKILCGESIMITRIQALNYRCLQYIDQRIGGFHLLVGPNATGKTTFLDVVGFLHDIVSNGPNQALADRTNDYKDLLYGREGECFQLAVEAALTDEHRSKISNTKMDTVRYELSLGIIEGSGEFGIRAEKLLLMKTKMEKVDAQIELFPREKKTPNSIISPKSVVGKKTIINKLPRGNDNFQPETKKEKGKRWVYSFRLGPTKSSLGNLPDDEEKFPVATWFRDLLSSGVQRFMLNSTLMKKASPPSKIKGFLTDGSNLPWVVDKLYKSDSIKYRDWLNHLQTALPDLEGIRTVVRPDDRFRYLIIQYKGDSRFRPGWLQMEPYV